MRRSLGTIGVVALLLVGACGDDGGGPPDLTLRAVGGSFADTDAVADIVADRLRAVGVDEFHTSFDGDRLEVDLDLPAGLTMDDVSDLLTQAGRLSFRPVIETGAGCGEATPSAAVTDDATVVLPSVEPDSTCYRLGPVPTEGDAVLAGTIVEDPEAVEQQGQWMVAAAVSDAARPALDAAAGACFGRDPSVCPTGQLAIVIDGTVQSAPSIQQPSFDTAGFVIAGAFTEDQARSLAAVLSAGAIEPLEVVGG